MKKEKRIEREQVVVDDRDPIGVLPAVEVMLVEVFDDVEQVAEDSRDPRGPSRRAQRSKPPLTRSNV